MKLARAAAVIMLQIFLVLVGVVFLIWLVSTEDMSAEPGTDGGRESITHIHDSPTSVCHVHHYLKNGVLDDQYDDGTEKYENAEYCPMAYDTGTPTPTTTPTTTTSTTHLAVPTPSPVADRDVRPARRDRPRQNHALPLPTPGHGWIWHTTPTAQVDESDVDEGMTLPPPSPTPTTTPTPTPTPLPITLVFCRSNHEIIWLLHWNIYKELACPGGVINAATR